MKTIWGVVLLILTAAIFFIAIRDQWNFSYGIGHFLTLQTEIDVVETVKEKPIYFFGDIMLARDVERRLLRAGGLSYAFQNISIDPSVSFAVANFEGVIPKIHLQTKDFSYLFSVREDLASELRNVGITHLSLANNHSHDFGVAGYMNTREVLNQHGLITFGFFDKVASSSVTVLETGEHKIGILGLMAVDKLWSKAELDATMSDLASSTDLQIVYIHWGPEYQKLRSATQRKQAEILSQLGADLIIGHHPHVVQGIEKINETLVLYSLGNFIFDQYFSNEVQMGLVVKLIQQAETILELRPVSSLTTRVQPRYLETEELQNALVELARISDSALKEQILSGHIILSNTLASSTKEAIMTR